MAILNFLYEGDDGKTHRIRLIQEMATAGGFGSPSNTAPTSSIPVKVSANAGQSALIPRGVRASTTDGKSRFFPKKTKAAWNSANIGSNITYKGKQFKITSKYLEMGLRAPDGSKL